MYKSRVPPKIKGYLQNSDIDLKVLPNSENLSPVLSSPITSPLFVKSRLSKEGKISGPHYINLNPKSKESGNVNVEKDLTLSTQEKSLPNINVSKINSSASPFLSPTQFDSSSRTILPDINSGSNSELAFSSLLQTEDSYPTYDEIPVFRNMNDSDFIKQDEFINKSPHFAKFSKLTSLLNKMDSKKSSLAKELFYYPDQIEMNKSLQENSLQALQSKEESELGIMSIF